MKFTRYNDNMQRNYILSNVHFFNGSTIMLYFITSALLILSIGSFYSPFFAYASVNNNIVMSNNENNFASSLRQVAVNVGQAPIITNISSKGIYEVQLGLHPSVPIQSLPKKGFTMNIFFMNASAPPATSKTIPNRLAQSGSTTVGMSGTQYPVPGSIKRLIPVNSFDMTIYDHHGKVLWNKVNQQLTGGVGFAQVVFPNGYTGDITILIYNIKSPSFLQKVPNDSVEFKGKVG